MTKLQEIIQHPKVFTFPDNGVYVRHLVPQSVFPKEGFDIFGSFICQFHSAEAMTTWIEIHHQLINVLQGVAGMGDCLKIIPFERFDDTSLIQERPFNEGYTTGSYSEYMTTGSCKPNPWILEGLFELRVKILEISTFDDEELTESSFDRRDQIIANVIHRTFLKPNENLVWYEPWALFLPSIEKVHLGGWNRAGIQRETN